MKQLDIISNTYCLLLIISTKLIQAIYNQAKPLRGVQSEPLNENSTPYVQIQRVNTTWVCTIKAPAYLTSAEKRLVFD